MCSKKKSKDYSIQVDPDQWAVKKDRGLTEEERLELTEDHLANPGLQKKIDESKAFLDLLKGHGEAIHFELERRKQTRLLHYRRIAPLAAIAALVILGLFLPRLIQEISSDPVESNTILTLLTEEPTTRNFPDGSRVEVNSGSELVYNFSERLREVLILHGEAHFSVVRDDFRPFVVNVGNVTVTAVGTAFNIRLDEGLVDVMVTHGKVHVSSNYEAEDSVIPSNVHDDIAEVGLINAGERIEIHLDAEGPDKVLVKTMSDISMDEALYWRESLLTFGGDTLANIAKNFEQKTGYTLLIQDPGIELLEIGGNYPSDDPYGFLNILKNLYGIPWTQAEDNVILVGKKPAL